LPLVTTVEKFPAPKAAYTQGLDLDPMWRKPSVTRQALASRIEVTGRFSI
jgi:hypothetical protein